jgi:hypothetical protein
MSVNHCIAGINTFVRDGSKKLEYVQQRSVRELS